MYRWKYHLQVDPNTVGREFEAIEKESGQLTRASVVDRARPKDAPLHALFQWDDTIAAEEYRKDQAGKLIQNLVIVQPREEPEKPPIVYRAFVNSNENVQQDGTYINLHRAVSSPETLSILLSNAKRELRSFREKYDLLSELAPIMSAIDSFMGEDAV